MQKKESVADSFVTYKNHSSTKILGSEKIVEGRQHTQGIRGFEILHDDRYSEKLVAVLSIPPPLLTQ